MKKTKLLIVFFIFSINIFAQKTKKILSINLVKEAPKIDGILNDAVWQKAKKATNFYMYQPGYGDAEPENQKTQVKMLYTHEAIYICATLNEAVGVHFISKGYKSLIFRK